MEMKPFIMSYELPVIQPTVRRDAAGQVLIDPQTGLPQLEGHYVTQYDHGRVMAYRYDKKKYKQF